MARSDDLRAAQRAIVAALSQHAAYNYRASSAVVNAINAEIDRLARQLTSQLSERLESLTEAEMQAFLSGRYTTGRLKAMKAEIDGWGKALDEAIKSEWDKTALALAGYEAAYAADVMNKALDGLPKHKPSPEKVLRKATQTPIMGHLVSDMVARLAPAQRERVYATIRQGIAAGDTNSQIIRMLRGTPALKYRDGLMEAAKRDVERLVRTARNHISNAAYEDTYAALGVERVVWVATLEGRTCVACATMDGKVFEVGAAHKTPPVHPNCRCVLAPALDSEIVGNRPYVRALKVKKRDGSNEFRSIGDMTKRQREDAGLKVGQVKATTTFKSWFDNQDAAFQREWMGPSRYKLYKEGGLSLDRFVDVQKGKQYSLKELRRRDAETFKAVFGE